MTIIEDSVNSLYTYAEQNSAACEELINLLGSLENAAADNQNILGQYVPELSAVIEQIRSAVEKSKAPSEEVCRALRMLADAYHAIIDNNPFK